MSNFESFLNDSFYPSKLLQSKLKIQSIKLIINFSIFYGEKLQMLYIFGVEQNTKLKTDQIKI